MPLIVLETTEVREGEEYRAGCKMIDLRWKCYNERVKKKDDNGTKNAGLMDVL